MERPEMDEAEFEGLLAEAVDKARGPVLAILHAHDYLEDVLQEAALKAWNKRGQFKGASKFSTWFVRIAIREALIQIRYEGTKRKVRSKSFVPLDRARGQASVGRNPEQRVIELESRRKFYEAIQQLYPKRRQELLRYIMSDLGDPVSQTSRAKTLRHRAIEDLKGLVKIKWRSSLH